MSGQNKPFVSVQPDNRTLVEEALEFAWSAVINQTGSPYPDLKQPMLTSEEFVSLLAGERGVTDWQPDDSLASKRKTADLAFDIHRKAGTRHGIALALDAIDCDVEITPWHQMTDAPGAYHIECVAWQRNQPVDKARSDRLFRRIENTKSERDTVELILALGAQSGFVASGALNPATVARDDECNGVIQPATDAELSLSVAGGGRLILVGDEEAVGQLPDYSPVRGALTVAGATRSVTINDIEFGAVL
ncbi:TPA: phage tail protein I [Vibrio vulnificus]